MVFSLSLIAVVPSFSMAWEKSFGGEGHDEALSLFEVPGGGFVVVGITDSFGSGRSDVYVLRLDKDGNKLWEKTFGGSGEDGAFSICKAHDGGFIITGFTESVGLGASDVYLIKIDDNGNKLWERTFGGKGVDLSSFVGPTLDEGYIITGMTESFGNGDYDFYILKVDKYGNKLWERAFGGRYYDEALSALSTPDGGCVVVGVTKSLDLGDAYMIRLDKDGNKVWEKAFGGKGYEEFTSIKALPEGGFIVVGFTESFGSGGSDIYVLKLDKDGNKIWEKTFGKKGNEAAFSVDIVKDGGYIVAGWTNSIGAGKSDVYILRLDKDGNAIWEKTFGGAEDDIAYTVRATSDGGYVVAGWSLSFGSGGSAYVLKLDKDGKLLY